ncbi:MAG: DUF2851 family protein [Chlorobi bacterium]|nr:DUF2851 family protein [Chlorobiota bacterium]
MAEPCTKESTLYPLWTQRAIPGTEFLCRGGERIHLLSPGHRNTGPGPDFLDAVMLANGVLKTGAVEMHRHENDWFLHGHQHDPAYQQVILHVVAQPAATARLPIPTLCWDQLLRVPETEPPHAVFPDSVSADLLRDLSWGRFLRRATEILRARQGGATVGTHLRHEFLRRTFDALGFSRNRAPMRSLAELAIGQEADLRSATFQQLARAILGGAGYPSERLQRVGEGMFGAARTRAILATLGSAAIPALQWDVRSRPHNLPEYRLWSAALLLFDLHQHELLPNLFQILLNEATPFQPLVARLQQWGGIGGLLGDDRAGEVVLNAFLPVALAGGLLAERNDLLRAACICYRSLPTFATNRLIRTVEERYLRRERLVGAFWQQGAIEFYQRYVQPDRSGLSFVADPFGNPYTIQRRFSEYANSHIYQLP